MTVFGARWAGAALFTARFGTAAPAGWAAAAFAALAIAAAVHLYACCKAKERLRRVTKPLLVPLVLCCHVLTAGSSMPLVIFALIFGLIGDILLIPSGKMLLFGAGGFSFLVGHVLYVLNAFRMGLPQRAFGRFGWASALAVALIVGAVGLTGCLVIRRRLQKKLRRPLDVYVLGLTAMAGTMVYSFIGAPCLGTALMAAGGALFAVSDLLLGACITGQIKGRRRNMWVMLTYVLAQAGIAVGSALV